MKIIHSQPKQQFLYRYDFFNQEHCFSIVEITDREISIAINVTDIIHLDFEMVFDILHGPRAQGEYRIGVQI